MGHAVGQRLREHELDVVTCLDGRSDRTQALAEKAGIRNVSTMEELVEQSDLIMSMTVSAAVPGLCRQVADALRATGADTLFAECNAISPRLVRELEPVISDAGGRFVDVSIIGGPPRTGYSPHFYTSGEYASQFEQLGDLGLTVLKLDGDVGQASGIKMCYAAMTKGTSALYSQLLIAAEMMGLPSRSWQSSSRGSRPSCNVWNGAYPQCHPAHAAGSARWRRYGIPSRALE